MQPEQKSSHITSEEISNRIVAGMRITYDLYNQLVRFLGVIVEIVQRDAQAKSLKGRDFTLPLARRKRRTAADSYLSVDMGIAFALGEDASDELDAEESLGSEIDEEEEDGVASKKGLHIGPQSQFLFVRVLLYEPKSTSTEPFVPTVYAAMLRGVVKRQASPKKQKTAALADETDFTVNRGRFLGFAKLMDANLSKGKVVSSIISRGKIDATISDVWSKPLAEFASETELEEFLRPIIGAITS